MNRFEERKRATTLRAVNARELIATSLPVVLPHLTPEQIDQLQRVLDVAVINAAIETKGLELDQQSIRGKIIHSKENLRDPAVVAQRDQVLKQKLVIKAGENAIALDYRKLLVPNAFKPTSDNPDEAAYLLLVVEAYAHHGVWLVLDSSQGAMTQQMIPSDPRKWRVRLLMGYRSGALVDEIKTDIGALDRRALLSVSRLGAGYAEWVHEGPTMRSLKGAVEHVTRKIAEGRNEHNWWSAHRDEFKIVSRVSDAFGGADWPDESIWDQPHKINIQARQLINEGKLAEAGKFTLLATYQAQWNANALHEYVKDTTKGASRVVTILEVAAVCGEIAGWILTIMAVGQGVIRLLSRKGGQAALQGGAAPRQLTGGQNQLPAGGATTPAPSSIPNRLPSNTPVSVSSRVPRSGGSSGGGGSSSGVSSQAVTEVQINMNHVRQHLGMPQVTQPGRLALSQEVQFQKHLHDYTDFVTNEIKALKMRKPHWNVDDMNAIIDRADAKFGGGLPGD